MVSKVYHGGQWVVMLTALLYLPHNSGSSSWLPVDESSSTESLVVVDRAVVLTTVKA
jgi:hypothetical protein